MKQVRETHVWRCLVEVVSRRASHGYVERWFLVVDQTEALAREKLRVYMQENNLEPRRVLHEDGILICNLVGGKKQRAIV